MKGGRILYVIKVNNDKSLTTTVKAKIYQYERNADTLILLLPMFYEEENIANCTVLLRYVLPNGIGKSEELEMCPEPYKDYYQYHLKVSTAFTRMPGKIELWLTVVNMRNDIVIETESTNVVITPAKDITKHLCPNDRNQLDKLSAKVDELERTKADNIMFDEDEMYLQLTANGAPIGDQVDMTSLMDNNELIEFDHSESNADTDDDVIYF